MSFLNRIPSLVSLVLLNTLPAAAVDVTSCGAVVPAGQIGVLMADLDCTGSPSTVPNVELQRGATLDMNGHSLSRQDDGGEAAIAILCPARGRCTITGPGTIFGHVYVSSGGNQILRDITAHDVEAGILAYIHGAVPTRFGKLHLTNVIVSGATYGGVVANRIKAENLQVTGAQEGWGIQGGVRGTNIVASANVGGGIVGKRIRIDGLVATNNGVPGSPLGGGVYAPSGSVRLLNSTVTGNHFNYGEVDWPFDIIAHRAVLTNTTCGHSVHDGKGGISGTLGVCAGD
jgi:hypothetical protein